MGMDDRVGTDRGNGVGVGWVEESKNWGNCNRATIKYLFKKGFTCFSVTLGAPGTDVLEINTNGKKGIIQGLRV